MRKNGHNKRPVRHDVPKDRLTFKFLRYIRDLKPSEAVRGTEKDNKEARPVSPSTIRNLRKPVKDGGTRYPQARTLMRVLQAHGASLDIIQDGEVWK